ncbi:MAG: endonuclease MutS2 [Anaerolineae bacterium]|nr:MAG: endonuclease MutS2 [Anaerolineae bacterium]
MDEKVLETLEFHKILARLAGYTDFSAGRALALALRPATDLSQAQARQQETTEARRLLDLRGAIGVGGARDVRPRLEAAVRGATLLPTELLEVAGTLISGRRLKGSLSRSADELPRLAAMAGRIETCPEVAGEIGRCLDDRGQVVDGASPQLARIRRGLKVAHDRLIDRLNRILASSKNAPFLQEALVTQRHGRYVIPLKADFKGRIPGIMHDQSRGGATLFIEPLATVGLNNQWRELQLEEEREVERILAHLSALVAEHAPSIARTVEALAELDLTFAKARYAEALDAVEAQLAPFARPSPAGSALAGHPGSVLRLMRARHPLLDPARVVPIDVALTGSYYSVVVTGPNTGGKTVALKTIGLLALMAQAGLHVPAREDSVLSVFEGVYADIGDEQSIEQSLSTFSGHLDNIIRILKRADARSLVLLDELGAGTDPVEGAALAQSILTHLLGRGITTFVATHYAELKAYAHTTPGVENASVEFDMETLSPTYELTVGLPGRSNALAIAARLGLPAAIIEEARGRLSADDLAIEDLLYQIKAVREATLQAQEAAQAARQAAEATARELEGRLAGIEEERREILAAARAEARQELAQVQQEIRRLRRRMALAAAAPEPLRQVEKAVTALEEKVLPPPPPPRPRIRPRQPLQPGDTVLVAGLGVDGQVLEMMEDGLEVQIGHFRVRVRPEDVELRDRADLQEPSPAAKAVSLPSAPSPGVELDMRGYRVPDALARLEEYLNNAFLAGLPWVRIIHGKGSGALRQAVRDALPGHALVASFRSGEEGEGGDGVTVARLMSR